MKKRGVFRLLVLTIFILSSVSVSASICENFYIKNPNSDKSLDITFVIDGSYTSAEQDYSDLKRQINDFVALMKVTPPFSEFIDSKINIRYVKTDYLNDFNCCAAEQLAICNHAEVVNIASICPQTDEIIIFSSNGNEDGGECFGHGGVAGPGQHAVIYDRPGGGRETMRDLSYTIIHELGHSLAFLADEYTEQDRDNLGKRLDFVFAPNCEKNPACEKGICACPKWRNVPGTGCFQGCTYNEWYRPTESGLMENIYSSPSPIDILQFRSSINRYVEYVQEPVSIEIHKKTTDFIINKFLEKNSGWIRGNVPNAQFSLELDQLNEPTGSPAVDSIIDNLADVVASGLTGRIVKCDNYRIESKGDPIVNIKFKNIQTKYNSIDNSMDLDIYIDIKIEGKARIGADGTIIGFDPSNPSVEIVKSCDELLTLGWETNLKEAKIGTKLYFSDGPLGIIKVKPEVNDINLPREDVEFSIINEENAGFVLGFILPSILDIVNINHFSRSYDFVTSLDNNVYSFKDEFNNNYLSEFGLSLKTSLDGLGLEELADMGKPHGMILDFYAKDSQYNNKYITRGIEIDSSDNSLRLSGIASFNKPLLNNRAECVKYGSLDFNPILYTNFERNIADSGNSFASIKLSQSFTNWFIATLWNDGFLCTKKNIKMSNNPTFVPSEFDIDDINYDLLPTNQPYIDYNLLEDINRDGRIDINHDIVAKGSARLKLKFNYDLNNNKLTEEITINFKYSVPFIIEEPEVSIPNEEEFSLSQSYLTSDVDNANIEIISIECGSGPLCSALQLDKYREALISEIKVNIAAHMDRALSEVPINPVRDIDLNFGEIGGEYFSPAINLNYGEYIARVNTREIVDKWVIYDFDLVEKCRGGEYCGKPNGARIRSIEEIFYKEKDSCLDIPNSETIRNGIHTGCKCVKKPSTESKSCVDALITAPGDTHHYIRITYDAPNEELSYNFNLISWNSFKRGGVSYVYLTRSLDTYKRLKESKDSRSGEITFIEDDASIQKLGFDNTQVIAFKSKTEKGVKQSLKCIAAVIIDTSPNFVDYNLRPALINVEQRLRSDVNDLYTICAEDDYPDLYDKLIFPNDPYSYSGT